MSKIAPFPHRYSARLERGQIVGPPRAPIPVGAPVQFGGTDAVWSPEELLVGAALECLWTTFEAYARHDKLEVRDFVGEGTAVLERGTAAAPVPAFSSITLRVEITVAVGDEELAGRLLGTAEERCIIANALRVPVLVEANIRTV